MIEVPNTFKIRAKSQFMKSPRGRPQKAGADMAPCCVNAAARQQGGVDGRNEPTPRSIAFGTVAAGCNKGTKRELLASVVLL
jgi:hypothetical protein